MNRVSEVRSHCVVIPFDNIDTDQIIPARFLKVIDRSALGASLFADWRYDGSGKPVPTFAINREETRGAGILVAGHNFGCGSSREHAPWALLGAGIRAVISTQFADIFRNNALKNGLLPVQVDVGTWSTLVDAVAADPRLEVSVDLIGQTVSVDGLFATEFRIESFARRCLMEGVDEMGYLIARAEAIAKYEGTHPQLVATAQVT